MKYYLLLALSLPLFSADNSVVLIQRLTTRDIAKISACLPKVTVKNIVKETNAADRLEKHISKIKDNLEMAYRLKFARLELLELIDKKSPEYAELDIQIATQSGLLIKAEVYFKNLRDIHRAIKQRIEKFNEEQEQQAKERINLLVDAIAGVGDEKLVDTQAMLEEFYASLHEVLSQAPPANIIN